MLGMTDTEYQNQIADLATGPTFNADAPPPPEQPGVFAGLDRSIQVYGAYRGANQMVAAGLAAGEGTFVSAANAVDKQNSADLIGGYQNLESMFQEQADDLRPDPQTVGFVGQTLEGLQGVAVQAALGSVAGPVGSAAVLGGSQGYAAYTEARGEIDPKTGEPIDKTTAEGIGKEVAAQNVVMPFLPLGIGGNRIIKGISGAAINTATDQASRRGTAAYLDAKGYSGMADQYRTLDKQGAVADVVIGAFFGALHGADAHDATKTGADDGILPSDVDAALAVKSAQQYRDSAPGIAVDSAALNSHDVAMQTAAAQVLAGEPVDVAGILKGQFIPHEPDPDFIDTFRAALRENGYADIVNETDQHIESAAQRGIDLGDPDDLRMPVQTELEGSEIEPMQKATGLSESESTIEQSFSKQLLDNFDSERDRYAALPDSNNGHVINTDTARELSSDYLADRTQSRAVHEPASWFTKALYAKMLAEPTKPGQENTVLFTAGGTGAGKSTGVKMLGDEAKRAQMIYDTNMNGYESSKKKIEQALAAGKNVNVLYVFRDPVDALVNGALPRAMRQEGEFGSGRTVPIADHLKTHIGARETMFRLAKEYAGNDRVKIDVVDNSHGKGNAKLINLEEIPELDHNKTKEDLNNALEQELKNGKISEAVHKGFAAGQQDGAGLREGAQSGRSEIGSDELKSDSETNKPPQSENMPGDNIAQQILSHDPDMEIPGPDGAMRASDALLSADQNIAAAAESGKLMEVAAACAGRFV